MVTWLSIPPQPTKFPDWAKTAVMTQADRRGITCDKCCKHQLTVLFSWKHLSGGWAPGLTHKH